MALKFLTEQDIEQAASQGITEIPLNANTRVTDLARDAAQRHGIRFVEPDQMAAPAQPPTSELHRQVRAAVVSQLGMEPAGLDAVIERVLKSVEGAG